MNINEVTREVFINHITDLKEDKFAKTFRAKCDMMGLWDKCLGIFEGEELCCVIVITISKREPKIANLQLIHTFFKHRKKGYARKLTELVIEDIIDEIDYLRVSAEKSAVGFYEKLGFKFLGEQKSGCQLSICKTTSSDISKCSFNLSDPIINKAVYRKGKGGCVNVFNLDEKYEKF